MCTSKIGESIVNLEDNLTLNGFVEKFGVFALGPGGVQKIRSLVYELAVTGKLSSRDDGDQAISSVLESIDNNKAALVKNKIIRNPKKLEDINEIDKPFGIPNHWQWVYLSDVGILENGDRSKNYPNKATLVDSGIPFVNAGHLQNGIVDKNEMTFITEDRFELLRSGKFKEGDILYCLRGSLGKCAIVRDLDRGAIASSLVIIRLYGDTIPEYMYNYFSSPLSQEMIKRYDNGTAQPNLSATDLAKFLIPFPPIEEQKRIVAKVDELMALCDQLEAQQQQQANTLLKANTSAIQALLSNSDNKENLTKNWQRLANNFHTLYGNILPMPPGEGRPKKHLVGLENIGKLRQAILNLAARGDFSDSGKGEYCNLSNCIELISGQHLKPNEYNQSGDGIPYITGPAEFGYKYPSANKWTQEKKAVAIKNDILLTVKGSGVGKTNICNLKELAISRQLMAVRSLNNINQDYIYIILLSAKEYFLEQKVGIAIPGISRKDVLNFSLFLPDLTEQKLIIDKVNILINLCDCLEQQLTKSYEGAEKLIVSTIKSLVA